jgi:hypothetical protein
MINTNFFFTKYFLLKKIKSILLLLIDFFQIITSLREIKNQSSLKTTPKHKNLSLN